MILPIKNKNKKKEIHEKAFSSTLGQYWLMGVFLSEVFLNNGNLIAISITKRGEAQSSGPQIPALNTSVPSVQLRV